MTAWKVADTCFFKKKKNGCLLDFYEFNMICKYKYIIYKNGCACANYIDILRIYLTMFCFSKNVRV